MAIRTLTLDASETGYFLYAKPDVLTDSPSWDADAVDMLAEPFSGYYTFDLDNTKSWVIFRRLSGSKLSSDTRIGTVPSNDRTGYSLTSDERNAIADALLSRNVSNVEETTPEHSLASVVLGILEWAVDNGVLTIYRTDGTTPHLVKSATSNANAQPVIKVD